uniref:Uncharacterized protein n=1 Tax=viral metagenome TaxID=1070528 RepID=A0A6M3LE07_9ZZZZ
MEYINLKREILAEEPVNFEDVIDITLRKVKKRLIEIDCRLNSKERDSGIAEFIDELEKGL